MRAATPEDAEAIAQLLYENRRVALPAPYRELLESVYGNVGLALVPRVDPAPLEGDPVTAAVDEPRSLGFLRLRRWDESASAALKPTVHRLLSQHVDVVFADLDLAAVGDVEEPTAGLNELGFFAAGLVLHGPDGHDHLRLQLLDCEDVELDDIVCDSTFAQALKRRVLEDRAPVGA